MKIIADEVPALIKGKTKVPLVTDKQFGICNSIDLHLLSVQGLQCMLEPHYFSSKGLGTKS